ncbi:MAG TPA: Rv3654c family TadE-like protein [Actinomycetota bacterium]|nr:Rv3654c family TadE-like protein [Actinomycetota bacterium]
MRPRVAAERGSASVLAAALAGLAMALALFTVDLARVVVARSRAQAAADAAALAAAAELARPSGRSPPSVAAEYAELGGAHLVECRCGPGTAEAVVTVELRVGLGALGGARTVTARARAIIAPAADGDSRTAPIDGFRK